MRIVDAKVIVCSPGRNFVTLKLETEDGVYGLGDATLNGRELAVASYLRDHVVPLLIGRDARRIEDIWQYLYKGAYWRRGPVTMTAIAAVDTALWDILGKTLERAGLPAARRRVARGGAWSTATPTATTLDDTVDAVAQLHQSWATRRCARSAAIPGVDARLRRRPRRRSLRAGGEGHAARDASGAPSAYLDFVPPLFERLRREFGPDVHLLHDVHHRLTPIEAARLGKTPRAVPALLARGSGAGREPGGVPDRSASTRRRRSRSARCSTRSTTASS